MAKKEAKANKKENSKNKKSFMKDFKAELKKVIWPTPKQLLNNTVAVLTIVLITAAIVFVLDLTFETLNKQGVDKVKQVVTSMNTTTNETTQDGTTAEGNAEKTENATQDETTQNSENNENAENNAE